MKTTPIKLNTIPSGTLMLDGNKWGDVVAVSTGYYLKTLEFGDGSTTVKAIRLFYNRTGAVIGELTSGYSARSAQELLSKYEWMK